MTEPSSSSVPPAEPNVTAPSNRLAANAWAQARRIPAEAACFALVAGAYLVHLFVSGYHRFYYDSADYWEQYSYLSRG